MVDDTDQWFVNPKEGGVRVVIITHDGEMLKYGVQLQLLATNNEYEGILKGLRLRKALGAKNLLSRVILSY